MRRLLRVHLTSRRPVPLSVWASGGGSAGPPGLALFVPLVSRPGPTPTGVPATAEWLSSSLCALLSRPGLAVWAQCNRPDAGGTLCPRRVCGPQDHQLGVKVPQERTGALPCRAGCRAPCLRWVRVCPYPHPAPSPSQSDHRLRLWAPSRGNLRHTEGASWRRQNRQGIHC